MSDAPRPRLARFHLPGPALCVAFAPGLTGRPLLAAAGADGAIFVWDPLTGEMIGAPLTGHVGPVRSIAFGIGPDGAPVLASGGEDGTRRLWHSFGEPKGDAVSSRTGAPVNGVAFGTGPNRQPLIASATADGTIELWDAFSFQPLGEPLVGHSGPVNAVAMATGPDGVPRLASAGDDGTVRLWNPLTGEPVGDPIKGHSGPVTSVAIESERRGRWRLESAGADGLIRLWDADSGRPADKPLFGHDGPVNCIAVGSPPDGADGRGPLLVSAGADGTVRRWSTAPGTAIGDPLIGHDGPVSSVAVGFGFDSRPLIASAGADGTIRLWDPDAGDEITGDSVSGGSQAIPDPVVTLPDELAVPPAPSVEPVVDLSSPTLSTDAIAARDDTATDDTLGRRLLADHLGSLLAQLTSDTASTDDMACSAVVHIDGRWGAGKSTLVRLLKEQLGTSSTTADPNAPPRMRDPIFIDYNAWRESSVGPEWWSLATTIRRHVRASRALPTRLAITVGGAFRRLFHSPATVFAILALAALPITRLLGWWKDPGSISDVLTLVATVLAGGLALGRLLFWTSPTIGRLSVGTDENPLGEIATIVDRLRRWSPRISVEHRRADWAVALWSATAIAASTVVAMLAESPLVRALALIGAAGLVGSGAWLYSRWLTSTLQAPRRAIVLVVDDIDRCTADRAVRLLETIHTLIRHHDEVAMFRAWRTQAPLVVLVPADARWVRAAFEKEYEDFAPLGSPVYGLGAEFVEKLFDHAVLVPALSTGQVAEFAQAVTGRPLWAATQAPTSGLDAAAVSTPPTPAESELAFAEATSAIEQTGPGQLRDTEIEDLLGPDRLLPDHALLAKSLRVAKEATPAATTQREAHLLTQYSPLLPANPRLVKRVANAWGMLNAVKDHVGHKEPADTVARAAVFLVRFPGLVDDLLTEPMPPDLATVLSDDVVADETSEQQRAREAWVAAGWRRPDVIEVLGWNSGDDLIDIRAIARCYGREFPPPVSAQPRPVPQPGARRRPAAKKSASTASKKARN